MKHTTLNTLSSPADKKLDRLQKRFQGIVAFLKKTTINKVGKKIQLAELPWYLLIGPSGAGKTTLLANSDINFILAKQYKSENIKKITPSDSCDWWITRDLVFVDVPGGYLTAKGSSLWKNLIQAIKTSLRKNTIQGIVIALNLPELLKKQNPEEKNFFLTSLKKHIEELQSEFGNRLPLHLIVTKCDFLPGFSEFFSESSSDELNQTWGVTLLPAHEKEKLHEVFTRRFNTLIKRLNKQLLWRIHQERDPAAKSAIKDFPLHIERLKENIVSLIKALNLSTPSLRGVYLTCGRQGEAEKPLAYLPAAHQSLATFTPPTPTRAYFVHQLILHALSPQIEQNTSAQQKISSQPKRVAYAASVAIIAASIGLLGNDFKKGVERYYLIKNDLALYQKNLTESGDRLANAIPLLEALEQIATSSKSVFSSYIPGISYYSNQSRQSAGTMYNQVLQTIVFPELASYFEKSLKTANEKTPEHVYFILKTYLMLNNAEHFQSDVMTSALKEILPSSMDKNKIDRLVSAMSTALISNKSFELNYNLINETRKNLTNLPSPALAFVILKNTENNTEDSLIKLDTPSTASPIFISKAVSPQIPKMFTAEAFQKILNDEISAAALESLQGNWVLGYRTNYTPNPSELISLASTLRNRYLSNYVDIWESLLANIELVPPATLAETDATVVSLTSNDSPFLQLLQTIRKNTSFDPIIAASPKLQTLNTMLSAADNRQPSKLYPIFVNLKQLHAYLQTILNAPNGDHTAQKLIAERLEHSTSNPISQIHVLAEQNPDPIKTWLNTIATKSQNYILEKS